MTEFTCTTKIVAGEGAIQALREEKAERALVVTDPFFARNGAAQRLGASAAPVWEIFDKVKPDPEAALVAEGTVFLQSFQPDLVVALGGGSAMDCAKAMVYFSGLSVRFVAVPTTSGSGSEMTDFAVLTHNGTKYPLVDPKLRPHVAILEGEFLKALPQKVVAEAGFDALSHGLEALAAKNANGFTDALATGGICRILTDLPASYQGDSSVRLGLHEASAMTAAAFNVAGLGVCHGISHSLGGLYHVPHGRLNALLLPAVLEENAQAASEKYARLAQMAGFGGATERLSLRNLKNGILRLRRLLALPENLTQAGISPQQLRKDRDKIIAAVLQDPCCQTNPVPVNGEMVWKILEAVGG